MGLWDNDALSNCSKEKHLKSRLQPQPKDGDLVFNNHGIIIKYGRFYSSLIALEKKKDWKPKTIKLLRRGQMVVHVYESTM